MCYNLKYVVAGSRQRGFIQKHWNNVDTQTYIEAVLLYLRLSNSRKSVKLCLIFRACMICFHLMTNDDESASVVCDLRFSTSSGDDHKLQQLSGSAMHDEVSWVKLSHFVNGSMLQFCFLILLHPDIRKQHFLQLWSFWKVGHFFSRGPSKLYVTFFFSYTFFSRPPRQWIKVTSHWPTSHPDGLCSSPPSPSL